MSRKILLLQGHPDGATVHFGHSLAQAYARGAQAGGHEVRFIRIAELEFPLLRSKAAWDAQAVPEVASERWMQREFQHPLAHAGQCRWRTD